MKKYEAGWLEALKRKHRYPGGWRDGSVADAFAMAKRVALISEPLTYTATGDPELLGGREFKDGPDQKTVNGELYARPAWLNQNLCDDWAVFNTYSRHGGIRRLGAHIPGKLSHTYLNVFDLVVALKNDRQELKVLLGRHTKPTEVRRI